MYAMPYPETSTKYIHFLTSSENIRNSKVLVVYRDNVTLSSVTPLISLASLRKPHDVKVTLATDLSIHS